MKTVAQSKIPSLLPRNSTSGTCCSPNFVPVTSGSATFGRFAVSSQTVAAGEMGEWLWDVHFLFWNWRFDLEVTVAASPGGLACRHF